MDLVLAVLGLPYCAPVAEVRGLCGCSLWALELGLRVMCVGLLTLYLMDLLDRDHSHVPLHLGRQMVNRRATRGAPMTVSFNTPIRTSLLVQPVKNLAF